MEVTFLTLFVGLAYMGESLEWRFHSKIYEAWTKVMIAYCYIAMAYVKTIDYYTYYSSMIA